MTDPGPKLQGLCQYWRPERCVGGTGTYSMINHVTSYSIMLTTKHVLGTYTFTNVSKHIFNIPICLLHA